MRELLAPLASGDTIELVRDFTVPLPMIVIAELLGVTPERRDDFSRWSAAMLSTTSLHGFDLASVVRANIEFIQFFGRALDAARGRPPGHDLVSQLAQVEDDADTLTRVEALGFLLLMMVAGTETTTSLLGNTMVGLMQHPEAYAALRADPRRVPDAIEEGLRWTSPGQFAYRMTTRATELAGEVVPEGTIVLPFFASANRDESIYPDPDRFDLDRGAKHMAFGGGHHRCIGTVLGRAEGRIALEELLALGRYELVDPEVRWAPSFQTRSVSELRLRLVHDAAS